MREIAQLFNSLDPTPFLNKDLDREAEAYIENWALGLRTGGPLHITIHVEKLPATGDASVLMTEAIQNYFHYKRGQVKDELSRLLGQGRVSLLIGVSFVALCLVAAEAIMKLGVGTVGSIVREGLLIFGWVAMWRPVQIFLYDWWPMARRIRVYKALSESRAKVIQGK